VPELERDEIRNLYRRKGFSGALLERVVATITADPDVWVAVMMAEEHHLAPTEPGYALRSAAVVGLASLVGSLVPLAPFLALPARAGTWVSALVAALVLFVLGAYKGRLTTGHVVRSGTELATIGTLSALASYVVGALLKVPVAS
jgi:VIT1/CCC1 family predicted Fe2+/Mn2+ transporter